MSNTNPKVDFFFDKPSQWQEEYGLLRTIILDCGLTEELKWGCPCYTLQDKNVVLIHGFKEYCAILFMKGALMQDPKGILIQQTENVQSGRQVRFTSAAEITKLKTTLKAYVKEAIELEKYGAKVELKKTTEYNVPEEFQSKLDKDRNLKKAFESLTPGRQRAYLFHFSQAKQSKTREARIEKYIPQILDGKGIDD
jgi:uncharacterized protein YdeI (YjbR/CyaY-like superfamily)